MFITIIFAIIFVMVGLGTMRANHKARAATQRVTQYQKWATPTTYYHYHSHARDELVRMEGDVGAVDTDAMVRTLRTMFHVAFYVLTTHAGLRMYANAMDTYVMGDNTRGTGEYLYATLFYVVAGTAMVMPAVYALYVHARTYDAMHGDRGAVDMGALRSARSMAAQAQDVERMQYTLLGMGYTLLHDNADTVIMEKHTPAEVGYHRGYTEVATLQRTTLPWYTRTCIMDEA